MMFLVTVLNLLNINRVLEETRVPVNRLRFERRSVLVNVLVKYHPEVRKQIEAAENMMES